MEQVDWESRWTEGRIAFHQDRVSDLLELYSDRIRQPGGTGRVLVPLCGKSLDMVFLSDLAEQVIGVEYVEQAAREFFSERGQVPRVESSPARSYSGGNITIFAADFFSLGAAVLGPVDVVFDRAALVALDPGARRRYASSLVSLLRPGKRVLLITFDYDQAQMGGPPYAVPDQEVGQLFGDGFEIERLETRDALSDRFRSNGVSRMSESAYLLTRLDEGGQGDSTPYHPGSSN